MILFIADEEFAIETDSRDPDIHRAEMRLRIAITEPEVKIAPPRSQSIEFVLDTGSDYAGVFPRDLATFDIPQDGPVTGWVEVSTIIGRETYGPMRAVILWLYGNVAGNENLAYPIYLKKGVVIFPELDEPHSSSPKLRPLLGMNALISAELRIEFDSKKKRFSAWIPETVLAPATH
jgi:hypothetical protein